MRQIVQDQNTFARGLASNILWTIPIAAAVAFLLFDNLIAREYFAGLSGTSIVSVLVFISVAIYAVSISFRHGPKILVLGPRWRQQFLILSSLISVILIAHLLIQPTWRGAQMLIAFAGFSLTVFVFSSPQSRPLNENLKTFLVGALLIVSTVAIARFSVELTPFDDRARGETWVIAAAIIPMIANRIWLGLAFLVVLSAATVVSDSRFAVASLAVVAVFVVLGLLRPEMGKLRPAIALASGAILLPLFALAQEVLSLRPSLELPPIQEVNGVIAMPEPDGGSSEQQRLDEIANRLRDWSFGRTPLWLAIIRTMEGPRDWIFGKGPGFASVTGLEARGINHPHNEYLRFLVDTGIIGLTLLILMGLTILVALFRVRADIGERQFWTGLSLVFLLASHSLVTNTLIPPHFWVPAAVFLGLSLRPRTQPT